MAYQSVRALQSAVRTTSGNGAAVLDSDRGDTLNIQLVVTAASGTTPTLDVSVQWSMDNVTWSDASPADSFAQMVTTGSAIKSFVCKAPNYRIAWVIGGTTPSFTFLANAFMTN